MLTPLERIAVERIKSRLEAVQTRLLACQTPIQKETLVDILKSAEINGIIEDSVAVLNGK